VEVEDNVVLLTVDADMVVVGRMILGAVVAVVVDMTTEGATVFAAPVVAGPKVGLLEADGIAVELNVVPILFMLSVDIFTVDPAEMMTVFDAAAASVAGAFDVSFKLVLGGNAVVRVGVPVAEIKVVPTLDVLRVDAAVDPAAVISVVFEIGDAAVVAGTFEGVLVVTVNVVVVAGIELEPRVVTTLDMLKFDVTVGPFHGRGSVVLEVIGTAVVVVAFVGANVVILPIVPAAVVTGVDVMPVATFVVPALVLKVVELFRDATKPIFATIPV